MSRRNRRSSFDLGEAIFRYTAYAVFLAYFIGLQLQDVDAVQEWFRGDSPDAPEAPAEVGPELAPVRDLGSFPMGPLPDVTFVVQQDPDVIGVEIAETYVERLGPALARRFGHPDRPLERVVYLHTPGSFRDAAREFHGRLEHYAGFFDPISSVAHVPWVPDRPEAIHTLIHEMAHQYVAAVREDAHGLGVPYWYEEGIATACEPHRLTDDGIEIGLPVLPEWIVREALRTFDSPDFDLREYIDLDGQGFRFRERSERAVGTVLVQFFLHGEDGRHAAWFAELEKRMGYGGSRLGMLDYLDVEPTTLLQQIREFVRASAGGR